MKILASDFDNTLYFKTEPKVKPQDKEAIKYFQGNGNLFGVCTGRGLDSVLASCPEDLVKFDFYILGSGGLILDKDKNVIYRDDWDHDLVYKLASTYIDQVVAIMFHNDTDYSAFIKPRKNNPIVTKKEEFQEHIHSVSFVLEGREGTKELADEINERFPEVDAFANIYTIDIALKGSSKGTGVDKIKQYYHADIAGGIGDSFNDLPAITHSDVSFAIKAGAKMLQDASDYVVEDIKEAIDILMEK